MRKSAAVAVVFLAVSGVALGQSLNCSQCHSDPQALAAAGQAIGKTFTKTQVNAMIIHLEGCPTHMDLTCISCHADIDRFPHPQETHLANPCVACHPDVAKQMNHSVHRDPLGGTSYVLQCWDCHGAHHIYPANDPRSPMYPYNVSGVCLKCHNQQKYLNGVHGQGVELAGLTAAATCISCHGYHTIKSVKAVGSRTSRRQISFTCGTCHAKIAEEYRKSVHGAALMATDNPDVPTCVDCHQAHQTADPRSPKFRAESPRLCGKCHANAKLMKKYGISTDVFQTYVTDFHGTTAELFEDVTPDQPFNQAVCYDCHGYHDVSRVTGVGKKKIEENLLRRCRRCHPGATTKFLGAWTGHFIPSPTKYPWIYYVKLFYRVAIPSIIGFFLLFIATDVYRSYRRRHRGGGGAS
ncbi:MAG: hypothetical protein GXP48_03555 [Acidobacteria bacterium]|nr:hypothetical protein [Acidobacteriota bacterium]